MTVEDLIKGCKRQDRKCQRLLYNKYCDLAISVSMRYAKDQHEPWDIVHDAFIKVFKYISKFDAQKGNFEQWFCKIVINEAIKKYKRNRLVFPKEDEQYLLDDEVSPKVLDELSAKDILRLLEQLPQGYRLVFNLYVVEGYEHKEIAKMLGITASASRSQLTRAKKKLKNLIIQQNTLEHGG